MNFVNEDNFKELMLKYEFALKRLETELCILLYEYKYIKGYNVVGIRIVCSFLSDVYEIVNLIKSSKEFIIIDESDYIKDPKDSGYSSYHLNILIPVYLLNVTEYIEVEIQIRTVAMDCWASLDHKLSYKLPKDVPEELRISMTKKAEEIRELDKSVQKLFGIVKKYTDEQKNKIE